jgi:hypothetical protein
VHIDSTRSMSAMFLILVHAGRLPACEVIRHNEFFDLWIILSDSLILCGEAHQMIIFVLGLSD